MAVTTDNRLGCGRDIDAVWAHADQPPSTHEASCLECQAARRSLTDLNEATQHLKTQDREDPDLHLAADVLNKVTAIARAEARRGARISLRRADEQMADLTISEQAVATVIRHASDLIPGLETRRCTLRLLDEGDQETSSPVTIAVQLRVSVSAASPITDQVDQLRERLIDALDAEIGLGAASIDVLVEDLTDA